MTRAKVLPASGARSSLKDNDDGDDHDDDNDNGDSDDDSDDGDGYEDKDGTEDLTPDLSKVLAS